MKPPRKTRSVRIESLEARSMFAADAMPWMPMQSYSIDKDAVWSGEPIAPTRDLASHFDRGPLQFHLDYDGFEAMGRMERSGSRGSPSRTGLDNTWINTAPIQIEIVVLTLPATRNADVRLDVLRPDGWIITSWAPSSTASIASKPRMNEVGGMNSAIASMRDPLNGANSNASLVRDRAPISASESREPLSKPISGERALSSLIYSASTITGAWLSTGSVPTALASSVWNAWVQSDVSMLSNLEGRAIPWSDVARRALESADTGDALKSESLHDPMSKEDRWSGTDRETRVDQAFADWDGGVIRRTPMHRSRTSRFELGRTAMPGDSQLPDVSHASLAARDRMLLMRTPRAMLDVPTIGEEAKPVQLLSSFGTLPPIARTLTHEGMLSNASDAQPHGTQVVSWPGNLGSMPTTATNEHARRSSDDAMNGTPAQRGLYAAATTLIVSAWVALQTRRAARSTAQSESSEAMVVKSKFRNLRSE